MATPGTRMVVKIGSAVTRSATGGLDEAILRVVVEQLADALDDGREVVLVSSGSVAAGRDLLGAKARRRDDLVVERQVHAAVGQLPLMAFYQACFARRGLPVAQVLATRADFASRRHYLNMRQCLEALLERGIVPVVNENDVVSVSELMFTDNDELAGLLAGMLGADRLVLLSDVDGVFDRPPGEPGSRLIREWSSETAPLIAPASRSEFGRGGMQTKVRNAERLAELGTEVWIASGRRPGVLADILAGRGRGTRFPSAGRRPSGQRRWIAGAPKAAAAALVINAGAVCALRSRDRLASLLPVGIVAVEGEFRRGDVVRILGEDGSEVGYGRAEQAAETLRAHLGQRNRRPAVHYDYLYVPERS